MHAHACTRVWIRTIQESNRSSSGHLSGLPSRPDSANKSNLGGHKVLLLNSKSPYPSQTLHGGCLTSKSDNGNCLTASGSWQQEQEQPATAPLCGQATATASQELELRCGLCLGRALSGHKASAGASRRAALHRDHGCAGALHQWRLPQRVLPRAGHPPGYVPAAPGTGCCAWALAPCRAVCDKTVPPLATHTHAEQLKALAQATKQQEAAEVSGGRLRTQTCFRPGAVNTACMPPKHC